MIHKHTFNYAWVSTLHVGVSKSCSIQGSSVLEVSNIKTACDEIHQPGPSHATHQVCDFRNLISNIRAFVIENYD